MTSDTTVATWKGTAFDDRLDEYVQAVAGAEAVVAWVRRAHAVALADALIAARELLASFDNAAALGDGAARAARKERIGDLQTRIDAYLGAADRLRQVQHVAGIAVELAGDAKRLGRAADTCLSESVAHVADEAAELGWVPPTQRSKE